MTREVYRYRFAEHVDLADAEGSLVLAILGAECLHGAVEVRLNASHCMDTAKRACVIDAGTAVGQTVNRLFAGFISRELGEDAFEVRRVDHLPRSTPGKNGHAG